VGPQKSRGRYEANFRSTNAADKEQTWVEFLQDLVMDIAVCGNTGDGTGTCGILGEPTEEIVAQHGTPDTGIWADVQHPQQRYQPAMGPSDQVRSGESLCRTNLQGEFSLAGMHTLTPHSLKTRPDRHPHVSRHVSAAPACAARDLPSYESQGRRSFTPAMQDPLLTTCQGIVDIDSVIAVANSRKTQANSGCRGFPEPLSISDSAAGSTTVGSIPRSTVGSVGSQGSDMQVLQVLLGDGQGWRPLRFHRNDDLFRRAEEFVEENSLSHLVKPGLVTQMRQMVMMRQLSVSVDVVDLF